MTIRKLLPLQQGYSGLSDRAKKILLTLSQYGGKSGILIGGTLLNPSLAGGLIQNTNSEIYSMTGRKPAIYKWMHIDPELPWFTAQGIKTQALQDYEDGIAACKAHWNSGGLVHLALMLPNIVSGGDWHDRQRDNPGHVSNLKSGGTHNSQWLGYLDRLAYTLNTRLVDLGGNPIPVTISWFPECNGWLDYLPNEGPDAAIQVAGRTLTSLSKTAGQPVSMTFTSRASQGVPFIPGPGGLLNVYGASDASFNGGYYVNSWVSGTSGDPVGSTTVSITAWKNGPQPNNATVDVSAGTTKSYPVSGGWSAGLDRAADLMALIQESNNYLRNNKGCLSFISSIAPFPDQYWSSRESNTNASGQPLLYSNWNPGNAHVDVGGMNVYRPNSNPTLGTPEMVSSSAKHRQLHGNKPCILNELGFDMEGDIAPSSAFRSQSNFWTREWGVIQNNLPWVSAACIWSKKFIPSITDPAFEDFKSLVNSQACVTLDNFKRLV